MKYLILVLCVITIFSCCRVAEELTLQKMNFSGTNLKLGGYYYATFESGYMVFFLYENGLFLDCGGCMNCTLENVEINISGDLCEASRKLQYSWGVFKVTADNIEIERWLSGTGGPYPTKTLRGEIINDRKILLSGFIGDRDNITSDTFYFKEFSLKPDSTNMFIN